MSRTIKFLALTFSEGLNVLVGFLFLPYLARAMDVSDYGTYGQAIMVILFLQGVFACGLGKVVFVFLANEDYPKSKTLYANLAGGFATGSIAAIVAILVAPLIGLQFDNPEVVSLIRVYALALPFMLMATSLNSALIFFDKVRESATIAVFTNLIRVGLIVTAVQVFDSLVLIFCALIFVTIIKILWAYVSLPTFVKVDKNYDRRVVFDQIKSGWPLGIASILGIALYSTDGYMVSAMLDVEQYAVYKNGAFQIPFISSIYGAVTAILLPDVSKYFFQRDFNQILNLKKKVIANTAMLIFPIVVFCIVFAEPLVITYLSEKYAASYPIFMVYNLMLLARFTSYDDLFVASNNNSKMPKIYLIALIANMVLNYFLIQWIGPLGAAIASVISFYILIALLFSKGVSFLEKRPREFFEVRRLGGALLLAIAMSLLFKWLSTYIMINAITLIFILGVYLVITYHFIIKLQLIDRNIITGFLTKFGLNSFFSKLFARVYES